MRKPENRTRKTVAPYSLVPQRAQNTEKEWGPIGCPLLFWYLVSGVWRLVSALFLYVEDAAESRIPNGAMRVTELSTVVPREFRVAL